MLLPALLSLALAAPSSDLADAVAAGDCATVLGQTADDPGAWRVPRAWCQLRTGEAAAAVATLSKPAPGVVGEYGRLVLARAKSALDDPEGAKAAVDGLELPGAAGREIARIRAGEEPAPPVVELPTEPLARALKLKKLGRIDEAAEVAKGVEPPDNTARMALARLFMSARDYPRALALWEAVLGPPAQASGGPKALFEYALSHARTGDYATAAKVYRRLMAQHPTHSTASFASYKLGYMAYDEARCTEAVQLFGAHVDAHPDSEHLDEALWFSGRCLWRSDDIDGAVAAWARLASERPKSSLVPGAAYWRARAKGRQGDAEGEKAALERVIQAWPTSGYAWFAAARLGRSFPEKARAEAPSWPAALANDPAVERSGALLALGFRDWARAELQPVRSRVKGREAALAAAWAFVAAGDFKGGRKLALPYCTAAWKAGDPLAQQACAPMPEAGIVRAVASRYELYPLLPYGIMTAESGLDPTVTSPAGARGLMQLMPKEGPRIHAALYADRPFEPDDLYSAPYNASMGTAELGMKAKALGDILEGDDLPAVIASYNGGEAAVRRWVEEAGGKPEFDEFAEDISFTETRQYVKRVLGFVMKYRWIYGDPPPTP